MKNTFYCTLFWYVLDICLRKLMVKDAYWRPCQCLKTPSIYKRRVYINNFGLKSCMFQPSIDNWTWCKHPSWGQGARKDCSAPSWWIAISFVHFLLFIIYKFAASFSLSNNWFQLQKNKWEFFMFLILEVSAMIITAATAVISMYTSSFLLPVQFVAWKIS